MAVAITRLDASASELREAAPGTDDARAARRMLAIAMVLDGWSRETVIWGHFCTPIDRFTEEAVAAWRAPATGRRGGQPIYSATAIETGLALRLVFHRSRQRSCQIAIRGTALFGHDGSWTGEQGGWNASRAVGQRFRSGLSAPRRATGGSVAAIVASSSTNELVGP